MRCFLGIDIGTYESKGVITDDFGRVVARAAVEHDLSIPQPGWAEADAETVWWGDFVQLTRVLLKSSGVKAADIAAIGTSAIGPCVLPIDEAGRPLRPAILYGIDTRAVAEVEELTQELGAEWIPMRTGCSLSSQSAGPKILWIRRHETTVWAGTVRVMTSTSWMVYRLTGRVVIDHYTAAACGPLYDLHEKGWNSRSAALICPEAMLPEIDWTTAIAGRVTEEAARQTGLATGTPVIVGTADAASEAVSSGVLEPGDTMLMYGSSLFFIEICRSLPQIRELWPTVYLTPGSWAMAAGMSTAGALTRWFRDQLSPMEKRAEEEGGSNAYQALADLAAPIAPGSEGLLFLPYFSGERTPLNDPLARGIVAGLTLSHTRAHLYRALLEGLAYSIRQNLEAMERAGEPPQRLVAVGGGTKNPLWVQIVSDVTAREQHVVESGGAAYGDAILAAVGVGTLHGIEDARRWVPESRVVVPRPDETRIYELYYPLVRELYQSSRKVAHTLARLGRDGGQRC
jgi:xylulokinase